MSLRLRTLLFALFLAAVAVAGSLTIVRNLRELVRYQQLTIFKDQIFHDHERTRELIQSAQAKLYEHEAGYTRDIDQLVTDIQEFETIVTSIVPHYRAHYQARECVVCHPDGQRKIEQLDESITEVLSNLQRYRESVSILLTTNDPNTRRLHNGLANARGEEILHTIQKENVNAGLMVAQLRRQSETILLRSERTIELAMGLTGGAFLITTAWLIWSIHRLFLMLLRGTESLARDDFSLRLPMATRRDEVGLLAMRFNHMAEHLQRRDHRIREQTTQLEEANRRLRDLNETLETKVGERTRELEGSLVQLRRATAALEESKGQLQATNQELVRANQAKSNFLSIISHELKTPLSVINGFLSLILDERYQNDPQQLREAVQISKRRGDQLSRMIDELIDLSRLDARAMILRRERTPVDRMLCEVGEEFREELRRRHIRFTVDVPTGLPPLLVDADKIRQVFANLVANAIKFTPEGGEIGLAAREHADEVLFSCRDTGIGIPAHEQEKIFEKFYQVDSSATRRYGGAGLGLSIVKEIVLLHGGRVWVESAPGAGSTFYVALPRIGLAPEAAGAPQPAASS